MLDPESKLSLQSSATRKSKGIGSFNTHLSRYSPSQITALKRSSSRKCSGVSSDVSDLLRFDRSHDTLLSASFSFLFQETTYINPTTLLLGNDGSRSSVVSHKHRISERFSQRGRADHAAHDRRLGWRLPLSLIVHSSVSQL